MEKGSTVLVEAITKATQTPAFEASKTEECQLVGYLLLNIQYRHNYLWHMGTSQMPLHTNETSDDVTSSFAVAYEDKRGQQDS